MAVSFIGGGTHRLVASQWQTLSHTLYQVHLAWAGFELTMLVMICTDCICSYKSNYYTITTTMHAHVVYSYFTVMRIAHFMAKHLIDFFIFFRKMKIVDLWYMWSVINNRKYYICWGAILSPQTSPNRWQFKWSSRKLFIMFTITVKLHSILIREHIQCV